MKLFWSAGSPYARKVMIVAEELGIAARIEKVNGSGTPVAPNTATKAYNPLGKLPCLVLDDGPAIFDSRVICQHLIASVPSQSLLPDDAARSRVLTLEALADGICDAAILMRYEAALRPDALRWQEWTDGQRAKIKAALGALARVWGAHLAGRFDLGHAAVGCALGYLDFRFPEMDWRAAHPALATWHESFALRPSAVATHPA